MYNDLTELAKALEWTTKNCPNAPYVLVKREIVERLVQIDPEEMRERVKTHMRNIEKRATVQPDEVGDAKQLEINCGKILAHLADLRAAIAAMMGGAK